MAKKIISIILSLTIILSAFTLAFAEEIEDSNESETEESTTESVPKVTACTYAEYHEKDGGYEGHKKILRIKFDEKYISFAEKIYITLDFGNDKCTFSEDELVLNPEYHAIFVDICIDTENDKNVKVLIPENTAFDNDGNGNPGYTITEIDTLYEATVIDAEYDYDYKDGEDKIKMDEQVTISLESGTPFDLYICGELKSHGQTSYTFFPYIDPMYITIVTEDGIIMERSEPYDCYDTHGYLHYLLYFENTGLELLTGSVALILYEPFASLVPGWGLLVILYTIGMLPITLFGGAGMLVTGPFLALYEVITQ